MKISQWIISLIVEILMFLVVFFIGDNSFSVPLLCGVVGFIGNALIGWNTRRKM